MIKFRYIYGFLILLILVGGFFIAEATGLFPDKTSQSGIVQSDVSYEDLEAIAGKGLSDPRGTHTIREIIVAYNLTREEFYDALNIPYDYPDTNSIVFLIKDGYASSKQVQAYMTPIADNFKIE